MGKSRSKYFSIISTLAYGFLVFLLVFICIVSLYVYPILQSLYNNFSQIYYSYTLTTGKHFYVLFGFNLFTSISCTLFLLFSSLLQKIYISKYEKNVEKYGKKVNWQQQQHNSNSQKGQKREKHIPCIHLTSITIQTFLW